MYTQVKVFALFLCQLHLYVPYRFYGVNVSKEVNASLCSKLFSQVAEFLALFKCFQVLQPVVQGQEITGYTGMGYTVVTWAS